MKHLHYCVIGKHWYARPECPPEADRDEHACREKSQIACPQHVGKFLSTRREED